MAAAAIPPGGITLRVSGQHDSKADSGTGVMLRLSDGMVRNMEKASKEHSLQFVTGSTPVRLSSSSRIMLSD